jgi:hypothetical protein
MLFVIITVHICNFISSGAFSVNIMAGDGNSLFQNLTILF